MFNVYQKKFRMYKKMYNVYLKTRHVFRNIQSKKGKRKKFKKLMKTVKKNHKKGRKKTVWNLPKTGQDIAPLPLCCLRLRCDALL